MRKTIIDAEYCNMVGNCDRSSYGGFGTAVIYASNLKADPKIKIEKINQRDLLTRIYNIKRNILMD